MPAPFGTRPARVTERRIVDAAERLFVAHGYGATTVAMIATEAGVSKQTVYNACGSKAELLKRLYDVRLAGDDEPIPLAERPEVQAMYADEDPERFLRAYAALGRTIAERVGPLIVLAQAGALGGDAELAAHVEVVEGEHLFGTAMAAKRVDELGALRPGLTVEGARDRIWTLTSPSVWHLLVLKRAWSGDAYAEWVGDALCDAVLAR